MKLNQHQANDVLMYMVHGIYIYIYNTSAFAWHRVCERGRGRERNKIDEKKLQQMRSKEWNILTQKIARVPLFFMLCVQNKQKVCIG